ncbi:16S rRNA (adenine(1518)-N(6)/adenine(1519)-N(6))-dimethyltransferase, partial [Flavobacteriaceae bacterium]|nr:16S rRNA (adenine(1518)-N(6)/adenine(1519)-N(6))-dimethyltransferase [Flavobacteriaceae bacterium]
MKTVRPKKKLGQHFLTDLSIAEKIANTLSFDTYDRVLEIGPGMGVLTQYLPWKENKVSLIELDS